MKECNNDANLDACDKIFASNESTHTSQTQKVE